MKTSDDRPSDRLWPLGIACGLLLVVLMNATFVFVSVQTAPAIEPSYTHSLSR